MKPKKKNINDDTIFKIVATISITVITWFLVEPILFADWNDIKINKVEHAEASGIMTPDWFRIYSDGKVLNTNSIPKDLGSEAHLKIGKMSRFVYAVCSGDGDRINSIPLWVSALLFLSGVVVIAGVIEPSFRPISMIIAFLCVWWSVDYVGLALSNLF